jgi:aminoglycoside phosphotransferase (APT) family kinase protein
MKINKDNPSPEFISMMSGRYPVEPQIDKMLVRKMERRSGSGYKQVPLDTIKSGIMSLLNKEIGSDYKISNCRWLTGGASKIQVAFTLEWQKPDAGKVNEELVVRMEPAESLVETSRLREFQLIKAVSSLVPVPEVRWVDEFGEYLPYPALIYAYVKGVTKPSATTAGPSGVGTVLSKDLREKLAPQFIGHLAAIHDFDFSGANLSAFTVPQPGIQHAQWSINWWDRVWEEDADEDIPLMRVASSWLRRNLPELDKPSIVHSDYRLGNFLFTEGDAKITAILDWELGRIGDRHQDLAWTTSRAFAAMDESGKNLLICGMMPESEFFDHYESATEFKINPKTLHWYKIYNNYSLAALLVGTGYRIALNGKTHQDILVTWLIGLGYLVMDEIRQLLERGA